MWRAMFDAVSGVVATTQAGQGLTQEEVQELTEAGDWTWTALWLAVLVVSGLALWRLFRGMKKR